MSRSVVGYIPSGYLNSAASASQFGSTDAESGLPIATGLVVGTFQEFSDAEAKRYSNPNSTTYPYTLYSGIYQWCQLDPAYAGGSVPIGAPLYYVETQSGICVTPVPIASSTGANALDWAGTNIDPNFSVSLPYAFVQVGPGKHSVFCHNGTAPTPGTSVIELLNNASDQYYGGVVYASALPHTYVGVPLATITDNTVGLARIVRPLARY